MDSWKRHWWKPILILILFGAVGRWDYEDSQRAQEQTNWARVARK